MHVRTQLRNAFEERLKLIPGFSEKVFPARVHPFNKDDLPGIVVKTEDESIQKAVPKQQHPRIQSRYIETAVYVFTRSTTNIEDAIDDMAELVEKAVFTDPTFGGIAAETVLTGITPAVGGEPDAPTGAHRMSFLSLVLTKEGLPDTTI